jgi:MYXO-CTERM domain-containing protein
MSFLVAPPIVSPGDAITLDLELDAVIPGAATVLFLLDGETLGEPASATTGIAVSVTRTLPSDLSIGRHRVEMVSEDEPTEVLASRTVDVIGAETGQIALPQAVTPAVTAPGNSLIVMLAAVALAAAGAAAGWRYRRRWLPKRMRT